VLLDACRDNRSPTRSVTASTTHAGRPQYNLSTPREAEVKAYLLLREKVIKPLLTPVGDDRQAHGVQARHRGRKNLAATERKGSITTPRSSLPALNSREFTPNTTAQKSLHARSGLADRI
jgi:hypothetical protein